MYNDIVRMDERWTDRIAGMSADVWASSLCTDLNVSMSIEIVRMDVSGMDRIPGMSV